jgi:hypothetical protein
MKKPFVTVVIALWATVGLGARSQPAAQDSATRGDQTAVTAGAMVHFEGCVYRGADVPGRARGVVGTDTAVEEYVLANTKFIARADGLPDAAAPMYRLDAGDRDRVSALVGKRVGVTGRIAGRSGDPLLQVTSIREIVGMCSRTPSALS